MTSRADVLERVVWIGEGSGFLAYRNYSSSSHTVAADYSHALSWLQRVRDRGRERDKKREMKRKRGRESDLPVNGGVLRGRNNDIALLSHSHLFPLHHTLQPQLMSLSLFFPRVPFFFYLFF